MEKQHPPWIEKVETIIDTAFEEGRNILYEPEVYDILTVLGIRTPHYRKIHDPDDISNDLLREFGSSRLVLKVMAAGVAHKHQAGGVKIVYKDLDFLKYSFETMRAAFARRGMEISGVLLVDFIDYSKDLGNEILLGFRESTGFGPVLSFSKGGTDAEHFAGNFSSPNLVLPPVNREWASALLHSTKIYKKYAAEHKEHYVDSIVEVQEKLSLLSVGFSNFFESPSRYVLKEFEINPFIFDNDDTFTALDGYAAIGIKESTPMDLSVPPKETLDCFFRPRGIGVIGISRSDNNKAGNIIVKNLLDLGRDDVYGVNPKGGEIVIGEHTVALHAGIGDLPVSVDLAVITVPAEATLPVVKACVEKGVKGLLLIPGGFSEARKNAELEEEILKVCRSRGIRIMGPNCLGIIYAGEQGRKGVNTFFIPEDKFKVSFEKEQNVALLSQSGAMGIMEIDTLKNAISPKVIVSYGNQLDIDPSDLVQYFEEDRSIDVIGLYIEGFKKGGGRRFFDMIKRNTTPTVVYKAGRTEAGRRATRSHTASIAGEYATAKAAMKQAGLIVADTVMDHTDFVKTFALLGDIPVTGNRVAVIANAGYEKTYAADNILDMEVAPLDEQTGKRLKDLLPGFISIDTFLDLTPMVTDEEYGKSIDIMLGSSVVDALCISIVPHAQRIHTTDREIESYGGNIANRIVETIHRHNKPVVVSVSGVSGIHAVYNRLVQILEEGGIPTFLSAGRAMFCLNEFLTYHLVREKRNLSEWLKE